MISLVTGLLIEPGYEIMNMVQVTEIEPRKKT